MKICPDGLCATRGGEDGLCGTRGRERGRHACQSQGQACYLCPAAICFPRQVLGVPRFHL